MLRERDRPGGGREYGADAAQQDFHLGRYLLISSSRPGSQAATLQGIWNVDIRPPRSCNYTLSIITPMNCWGAEVAGLAELHGPLFVLARDLAIAGRTTAGLLYSAPGAAAHHNTDIWRRTTPVPGEPEWSNGPTGLVWLSEHFAARDAFLGVLQPRPHRPRSMRENMGFQDAGAVHLLFKRWPSVGRFPQTELLLPRYTIWCVPGDPDPGRTSETACLLDRCTVNSSFPFWQER